MSREFVKPSSSRAWSLRSSNLRDLHRASDSARLYRTRHNRPRRRRIAVAGITCLEWRIGLAPYSPAVGRKPPPFGMSGYPDMTRTGVINPCTRRDNKTTDVPFRYLNETLVTQSQLRELEPFPHAVHQHHSFPSSETPSTHGS